MTHCQSPDVLKKAHSELQQSTQLHRDTMHDLCLTAEAYRSAIIGRCIDGYIQQLGFIPFVCVFYKEEQVEAYINQCKDDQPCVEHFDATGSVVARRCTTEDQPVYFYSMIMRRGNMPFLEFLSNRHSGSFVCGIIMNFLASVRSCNNGNTVVPQTVVVDFSYALMGAVLLSFNSMTLTQYLLHTFQILRHGDDGRHRMTTVVICCAHMTHAAARRMTLKESSRDKRRNAMIMFTALQRADNLSVARSVYHDASVVLCSEYNNDRCKQAYRRLMAVACRLHADSYCDEDEVEQPETETVSDDHDYTQVETKKTLKDSSPFTHYFKNDLPSHDSATGDSEPNPLCSVACFDVLSSLIHLWPLWSAALQSVGDSEDMVQVPKISNCSSNASVESYFKSLKHCRIGRQPRMQAAHFVNRQLVFVNGKLNELMLPKRASKQRGRKRKELISAKEKWGRRKQKKKYYGAAAVEEQLQRYPVDEDVENDNGTLPRSPLKSVPTEIVTGQEVSVDEMNDEEVYQYTTMLKQQYGNVVDGLDFSGQGQCVKGRSLPRFHAVPGHRRFVQILNVGDHWICITNVFSSSTHDVFVFDGIYDSVSSSTQLQTSSLLRAEDDPDYINFHVRRFQQQPRGTRSCGYYAVVAAIGACAGVDVTGHVFSSDSLIRELRQQLQDRMIRPLTGVERKGTKDVDVVKLPKLHCVCHSPSRRHNAARAMIQCSYCLNWYHCDCVHVELSTLPRRSELWEGPCCHRSTTEPVHLIDESMCSTLSLLITV